ncbi:MAG: hypothetical protein QMC89_05300 [Candidatus Hodarchaeaceae archaeon]|nr:hypothetical protein [Candidatus Hodarchaeaceae archaeon]
MALGRGIGVGRGGGPGDGYSPEAGGMRAKISALALLSLGVISATMTLARPQLFSVSPAEFLVEDAPPMGEPYMLERKLVVRNGDNIKRTFALSVLAPPRENLREGYEAIPDPSWVIPTPAVLEIDENSSGTVDIYLNIPRQENLTSQRWEVWISVRRLAEVGEVFDIEYIVIARIETASELPPPPSRLPLLVVAIAMAGVAVVAFSLGSLARRRRAVKRPALLRLLLP